VGLAILPAAAFSGGFPVMESQLSQ
jgi:hypothetical protein